MRNKAKVKPLDISWNIIEIVGYYYIWPEKVRVNFLDNTFEKYDEFTKEYEEVPYNEVKDAIKRVSKTTGYN